MRGDCGIVDTIQTESIDEPSAIGTVTDYDITTLQTAVKEESVLNAPQVVNYIKK